MSLALVLVALAAAFLGARWSGQMLDRHYNDAIEVAAVLTIALCVFAPLALNATVGASSGWPIRLAVALAVCGGLFSSPPRVAG